MLRRALRYGPVQANSHPSAMTSRGLAEVFPVGSRLHFGLFVLALHASAALVFALGVYAEQAHTRIGTPFVLASTGLVALVGMTAYGVSASLPLDVVVDDAGVTFAGAFVPWADVARVERRRGPGKSSAHRVVLVGPRARFTLGPGRAESIDDLVTAVRARMAKGTTRDTSA
jgi:hypothetical protein